MKPEYIQILKPSERAAAIKLGMAVAAARNRMPLKQAQVTNPFTPSGFAHGITSAGRNAAKTIIALALITGAPVGALAHVMERKVKGDRKDTKERLERIKYYRDTTQQLKNELGV